VKSDLKKVIKIVGAAQTIGLMTHINGDGDAFGSLLGLRNILELLGKEVILFSNEPLPRYLEYRRKQARYEPITKYKNIDLLVGLDAASKKRFTLPEVFETTKKKAVKTLIIDHHSEGDLSQEADFVWRKTDISSTAEMIYWLAVELGIKFDKSVAEFLLWGLETDTYFLSNPNVFESTEVARKSLQSFGASTEEIKENTKAVSPTSNQEFMAVVIGRIQSYQKADVLFTYVTARDKEQFGIQEPASSAIANYIDYNRNPGVVIVAEQRTPELVKVSMRSNHSNVDVAKLSSVYGGGGHVKAAGFEVKGLVEKISKKLVEEIISKLVDTDLE
jgi:phosphoesterase RecJ-like protein